MKAAGLTGFLVPVDVVIEHSFALSLTVLRKMVAQSHLHYGSKRYDLAIQNLALSECRTVPRRLLEIRQ